MLLVQESFPRMVIIDGGRIVADGAKEILMEDELLLEAHGLGKPQAHYLLLKIGGIPIFFGTPPCFLMDQC